MNQPDVVCLGETMVLVTPTEAVPLEDAPLFHLSVGGAESTVAMYLAEAGYRTSWASALGDDPFATRILRLLSSQGVDTSFVQVNTGAPTGIYFKNPGRESTQIHYYRSGSAASTMSERFLDTLPLEGARLVHVTGITPALSSSCNQLVAALPGRLRTIGAKLSFDVNYRPGLWPVAEAAPVLLNLASQADYVFVGRDEAELLWGTTTPASIRDLIGPTGKLVVKDGAVGATEFSRHGEVFVEAQRVDVVEVVGAGDAFAAGYLSGQLQNSSARECLRRGHELAARTLQSTSDFVPLLGRP
ncbi:sugar kinase [Arthrobacter subterraneus]|uniref:sugar kinase n=1 Tax=Arthrobacter subterraneus TaxID=335973 RepID=UPI0038078F2D